MKVKVKAIGQTIQQSVLSHLNAKINLKKASNVYDVSSSLNLSL